MKKFISVSGMTTERCRKTVISCLEQTDGVEKVTVNLPTGMIEVTFKEEKITLDQLKQIIMNIGYDPM